MKKISIGALVLTLAVMLLSQAANGFFVDGSGNATANGTIKATDGYGYVPIGTILPWYDKTGVAPLPQGWVRCDSGVTVTMDANSPLHALDGSLPTSQTFVVPNLNKVTLPVATFPNTITIERGAFLRGGASAGTWQDDNFQGHRHVPLEANGGQFWQVNMASAVQSGGYAPGGNFGSVGAQSVTGNPSAANLTDGTPRFGKETRPLNMSVIYIMRVK